MMMMPHTWTNRGPPTLNAGHWSALIHR